MFNRLIHGDCVAGMKDLPENSVDLAFADPPYNIGYEYDTYDDRKSCDEYLNWCREWTSEIYRVLKPAGAFWLAIGDEYAAEMKVMLTRERTEPFFLRSWVIWYYTFGVNCKNKFSRSHAHLLYFVKDPEQFTFNAHDPAVRVPSARQLVYGDKRANPTGRLPDDTWITEPELGGGGSREAGDRVNGVTSDGGSNAAGDSLQSLPFDDEQATGDGDEIPSPLTSRPSTPPHTHEGWFLRPQDVPNGFAANSDTWYFPRVAGTFKERSGWHGCQMPERLLARIILSCSNAGDVVIDPFAGSGTTLAVAKKLGRQWLGYDMSPDYAAKAESRLAKIKVGDSLDGAADPLKSVPATRNGRKLKPRT